MVKRETRHEHGLRLSETLNADWTEYTLADPKGNESAARCATEHSL
jgi:hypothetical protein